jgi:integration host factor subunit beta
MNKSELIASLAEETNLTLDEATAAVNVFFDSIRESLLAEERVEIRGFGSFKMKTYEGYTGRNPKSGELVSVQPKRLPFFRGGKELKEFLNE